MVKVDFVLTSHKRSLTARALHLAVLRIGLVSLSAGTVSYFVNLSSIEGAITEQLLLSTEQTLQLESLPFREIKDLQQNFLNDFKSILARPGIEATLVRDFNQIFYRHEDGSYTQRPMLFEGKPLADGRRFAGMSATYAPDTPPNDDVKTRLTLSYILSHKYGSSTKGRLFNFYGVVPEKGFPIYQESNIAEVFTYSGPDALKLETYEFYERGFGTPGNSTLFTRMYWDYSNNAWMTTIATPDVADTSGKHRILVCVDVLLDELMKRTAKPFVQDAYSVLFTADSEGTLIYHPDFMEQVKSSEGKASIQSLKIVHDYPLLDAIHSLTPGKATVVQTYNDIVAMGIIPGTPWVLAVHYPRAQMTPAILTNLAIVIALGLLTLLVEIFILRSILQKQVAIPLSRLMQATRLVGLSRERLGHDALPTQSTDEIGELARDFANMADRIQGAQEQLELQVQDRTAALEEANRQLKVLSTTDGLTGLANRRHFDEALISEWHRAQRTGTFLSLMLIDVDYFKKYNDHYGHQAGDDCLRSVASVLEAHALRAGDLVARYGGEEFALITTIPHTEKALQHAQALCRALEKLTLPHALSPLGFVTASIGVAVMIPKEDRTPEYLLKQADLALYCAKAQGRNQAVLATSMAALSANRLA
ncbi:sensor domain-containing diguanylate cyclase [Pseudomonas gingeri]|uniref:sensor domain-containing diguanylate cyclase n=1 Tax=Pseudomonas gingeri TaxID=117681 RepID=UPI0015A27D77|nr:diguanylate cyclase [Pseudomonas gingeri]NVZ99190.1 diguanylate cyclase [Pseudomonas gingeri]NWA13235.1 diguanylate cyclase [Pseudomonas gingeri]NWA55496.1 diguanylate cyclase [Pseudomonas gingeri]NWA95650.1 diguanylate cyclase [Pseudomonas gingeri]NWB00737.1 diguanylate cyclase [Pseudomonas gingeri]